jgi:hypothetical protein
MLIYSPLSAYFDDVIPEQPALSNDGKQRQPALGDCADFFEAIVDERRETGGRQIDGRRTNSFSLND